MAFVEVLSGKAKGRRIEIDRDDIIIGRSQSNVLMLEDSSVSGEHCAIRRNGRKFTLYDLESTNGTRLNSVNVTEHQLSPKDIIGVGSIELLFDGDDVDGYEPVEISKEDTRATVKLPPTGSVQSVPVAFDTHKSSRGVWTTVAAVMGVFLLAAAAMFLYRLFAD